MPPSTARRRSGAHARTNGILRSLASGTGGKRSKFSRACGARRFYIFAPPPGLLPFCSKVMPGHAFTILPPIRPTFTQPPPYGAREGWCRVTFYFCKKYDLRIRGAQFGPNPVGIHNIKEFLSTRRHVIAPQRPPPPFQLFGFYLRFYLNGNSKS